MSAVVAVESRVPAEEYHARPGVSITRLKELKRSPQHYRYFAEHPKESKAMTLGTAAHCAVLEPERFSREFAVWGNRTASGRMSPRSGKAWEAFEAENAARTIITADEAGLAAAIQQAVRGDKFASRYLESGDPEVSMMWEYDGRQCRGRADWITSIDGRPNLVGLKTARDCRPFIFGSAAAKLGYHLQWGFYHDGWTTITGVEPRMVEIVVEATAPHAVVVYVIPEDIILQGRDEYQQLMQTLRDCEAAGEWPGPAIGEQILTLPSWVYGEATDDITDLGLEA